MTNSASSPELSACRVYAISLELLKQSTAHDHSAERRATQFPCRQKLETSILIEQIGPVLTRDGLRSHDFQRVAEQPISKPIDMPIADEWVTCDRNSLRSLQHFSFRWIRRTPSLHKTSQSLVRCRNELMFHITMQNDELIEGLEGVSFEILELV